MVQLKVDDGTLTHGIGLFLPGNFRKDSVSLESKYVFSYGTGVNCYCKIIRLVRNLFT